MNVEMVAYVLELLVDVIGAYRATFSMKPEAAVRVIDVARSKLR